MRIPGLRAAGAEPRHDRESARRIPQLRIVWKHGRAAKMRLMGRSKNVFGSNDHLPVLFYERTLASEDIQGQMRQLCGRLQLNVN